MRPLFPFAMLGLFALTSCQPPTYSIIVKRVGSDIVFDGEGDESWPFGWDDDTINAGIVNIYNREGKGWSIYQSPAPECDTTSPRAPFPLVYGKLPRCFSKKAPADPIEPGVAYKVDAGAGMRSGMGAFRVEPSGEITALSATAMGVDGEEWPPQANPDYLDPALLNGSGPEDIPASQGPSDVPAWNGAPGAG
jgi:hypothetical protein